MLHPSFFPVPQPFFFGLLLPYPSFPHLSFPARHPLPAERRSVIICLRGARDRAEEWKAHGSGARTSRSKDLAVGVAIPCYYKGNGLQKLL